MKYLKLISMAMMAILIFSCTVQKDRKALSRVKANITLLDQAFVVGLKLHPCANDSTVITKMDTTTVFSTVIEKIRDTVYVKTTKIITLRDTVKIVLVDRLKTDMLTDSVNQGKQIISERNGQITEKDKQIKAQKKTKTILWTVIAVLGFLFCFGIYMKLSKPKL